MTTKSDHGLAVEGWARVPCPLGTGHVFSPSFLALRDMRSANHRDEETGGLQEGHTPSSSWMGLTLGMIVLDSLTPADAEVGGRWRGLLTAHDVDPEDAMLIYKIRCALLHGYGLARPQDVNDRKVVFTGDPNGYALDTERPGHVVLSVPVFCGHLVERIAAAAHGQWDTSLLDTQLPPPE
jgi:hypothetical protein